MSWSQCIPFFLVTALLCGSPVAALEGDRPNFILVIADDISWDDLGCYGNSTVRTPHLDRLADQGLVFDNAYLTASSCSPSRCSMITGRYPHNTGAAELHMDLPEDQFLFPLALKQAGYYTVLSGKNHMGSAVTPAFSHISRGKGPGREDDWVELLRERPAEQPFFFWFASTDAHRGWQFTEDVPRYDPATVPVPSYLFDGPQTRQDLADYYHEVSRVDAVVGELLEELQRQEVDQQTYFVFCSDNGRPFPRCKTRLYDSGIKTPLLIWRPGTIHAARTDSLVSALDLAPTILELAGVELDPRLQGVSLRRLLEEPATSVRDYVFAEHNWHVYQAHERMVRHENLVYLRNAFPERQNLCMESIAHFPAGVELWNAEAEGKLSAEQRDVFQVPRPAEELYDLTTDPDQLVNLANEAGHAAPLAELRAVLDRWALETGDSIPQNPTPDRGEGENPGRAPSRGEQPGSSHGATQRVSPGPLLRSAVHLGNAIKVGEVTAKGAIVWARLTQRPEPNHEGFSFPSAERVPQVPEGKTLAEMEGAMPGAAGQLRLTYWQATASPDPPKQATTDWVDVDATANFAHRFQLTDLAAGSSYQALVEGRKGIGGPIACRRGASFATAPAADQSSTVSFCVVTGQGYWRRDEETKGHRIYRHMRALSPDFLVHTGDTIYYDRPEPYAQTLELARFKWDRMYALENQREFHCSVPGYFLKDDHDTLRDDCWPGQTYGELTWELGLDLFREQLPVGESPYRTVRWGKDLQIWLMEGREFRSNNRQPDGPTKTIWGEQQKRWLFETVGSSDATFRIVISPTPLVGPDRPAKNDNHSNAGFSHEGREVRSFLAKQAGLIVICGDRHWQYVSTDADTGLVEFSCGPTSDAHAAGFREKDRSPTQSYLKVCGGFLHVLLDLEAEQPRLILRHRDTEGELLHEELLDSR